MMTEEAPAIFSPDRRYRYLLRRKVGAGKKQCLFIMLNPSTADEVQNDPSVRRCIGFAHDWWYGRLVVANIFALRSTDPKTLYEDVDPVGWENNDFIVMAAVQASRIVIAWGNHGALGDRGAEVLRLIHFARHRVYHLGKTQAGHPKHPLYIAKNQELLPYITVPNRGGICLPWV